MTYKPAVELLFQCDRRHSQGMETKSMERNASGGPGRIMFGRWPLVLVLALSLGVVAPLAGQVPSAPADDSSADISGKPLQVNIRYPDRETQKWIERPAPSDQLPSPDLLSTPLSGLFDRTWNTAPDQGTSMRDKAWNEIRQTIMEQIAG